MPLHNSVVVALLSSLLIALAMGPLLISYLRRLKAGAIIREEGPQTHLSKAGTPLMGGALFIVPGVIVTMILAWVFPPGGGAPGRPELLTTGVTLLLFVGAGLIGFVDDFRKMVLKSSLGLRAREKLVAQLLLSGALGYTVWLLNLGTYVKVPIVLWQWDLGPLYYAFILFLVVATTNALNLTDGLDGLDGGLSVISYAVYGFVAIAVKLPGLAIFAFAVVGGLVGFLRYNAYPARVFMGDFGSMALGGGLAALAVLTKTELILPILGFVYAAETLSVILQVASFRLTGKRIFRMSPLHHHFELLGWPETTVLRRFWAAGVVCAVLAWVALRGWVF